MTKNSHTNTTVLNPKENVYNQMRILFESFLDLFCWLAQKQEVNDNITESYY